jgi:Mn-containing catalase
MFFHTARLQFESQPGKPDPVYARTNCRSCSAAATVR